MEDTRTSIDTGSARFHGIEKDGIRIFRGITYARYGRFEEAVPVQPEGDIDATTYGCVCPQRSNRLASIMGEDKGSVIEEGRLCLSIYSPAGAKDLPVMVWIHGGAFLTGGSEEQRYSGERLVRTGNVVVVKISYRLGAFGFLHMPDKGISNLGLHDQRTALEWVQEHISAFGGNPDDVTVFGQSAGALSVAALIATSTDRLLFRKAILQSAPLGIGMTPKEADRIAKAFMKRLGKDLKEATMDELLDAQEAIKKMKTGLTFMPLLPDFQEIPELVRKSGLKVVVGYTAEDASPFLKGLGFLFDTAIGRAAIRWATRTTFSESSEQYLGKLREAGLEATKYFISWHPEGNPLGACHCIELPFILGEYEDWCESKMLQGIKQDEYSRNSGDLLRAWTTFAREGRFPGGGILQVAISDRDS